MFLDYCCGLQMAITCTTIIPLVLYGAVLMTFFRAGIEKMIRHDFTFRVCTIFVCDRLTQNKRGDNFSHCTLEDSKLTASVHLLDFLFASGLRKSQEGFRILHGGITYLLSLHSGGLTVV